MSLLNAVARWTIRIPMTLSSIRCISITPTLCAEPLKKKKKLDPQIIKQREDRKRKKIEKQIRRLEKNARQLKPIDELEVPLELLGQKEVRARQLPPLSAQELEKRMQLKNQWAHYRHVQKVADFQIIDRLMQSQRKALQELRNESEELYQEAIQKDLSLVPVSIKGPVSTPPIEGYNSPDGDYNHKARKWE